MAAAILEKRKALVARQFTSATVEASNKAATTSEALRHSSGAASKGRENEVGGMASAADPDTS